MTRHAFPPLLALMLGLAPLTASAQETAPAEAPAAEAPAAETAAPAAEGAADGLSLGTPAEDGLGSTYVAATFDAWEQRCVRTGTEADPCQLYQLLKDAQGNSVAEISIFGLPAGTEGPAIAGANFIAPLETLLTAGLQVQVDNGGVKTYPFSVCSPIGCVARLGLTAEEIAAFKAGAVAKMTIVPFVAPDQKVELPVSLKGFTAGMAAVDEANAKADAMAAAQAPAPIEGAAEAPATND